MDGAGTLRHVFPSITSSGADEYASLRIAALEPDGAGGFHVGGFFDRVLGTPTPGLVHLRADGMLDPGLPSGNVERDGARTRRRRALRGQLRRRARAGRADGREAELGAGPAYDLRDGTQLPFSEQSGGDVLAVGGGAIAAGGSGSGIWGTTPRAGFAALDLRSDALLPFATVGGIGNTLFVGGTFDKLGTRSVKRLGAVDLGTGEVLDWAPNVPCEVYGLAVSGGRLHVAGCELRVLDTTTRAEVAVAGKPLGYVEPDRAGGVWTGGPNRPFLRQRPSASSRGARSRSSRAPGPCASASSARVSTSRSP